jgi:hypothetical protein
MKVYKGVGYWISPHGLLVSHDKGETWSVQGQPLKDAVAGPFFGENEKQIVVVTRESFFETHDGGETWKAIAPSLGDPDWDSDHGETRNCRYYACDFQHRILYGAKLRQSAAMFVLPATVASGDKP